MADVLYMTVKEYAKRVSTSPATISEMCRKGQLPAVKMGGWKINVKRADEMLEEQINQRLAEFAPKVVPKVYIRGKSAGSDYLAQLQKMRQRVI